MSEKVVKYAKSGAIATNTLSSLDKAITIRPETMCGIDDELRKWFRFEF